MSEGYSSGKAGIEAAKLASQVKGSLDNLYSDPFKATWEELRNSTAIYYNEDIAEAVIEMIQYAKSFGLPPRYFPQFWDDLCNIRAAQEQLRVKYAKGDMSSYGYLKGKPNIRGEPVWDLSEKWFTYHMDPGGSGLIDGPRGAGKSLLGTQNISLPYIESRRHVVTGIYADDIKTDKDIDPWKYYHYHSSMNRQLQTAIQIKINSLEKQRDEGKEIYDHPLVIDMIDEASLSRGKYRTTSDKTMQQMYVAAIARHIGIYIWEIHPFDDAVIWVRDSMTHKYAFTERGKMDATIWVAGQKYPKEKKIWGFKSLEDKIRDGKPHVRYRPHAPVSFTVDVDIIAMLDHFNRQFEVKLESGKKVDEIEEWRVNLDWLKKDKEAQLDSVFGLTYNSVVSSIALFMVKLEEYNKLMKGTDRYKPVRVAQQLVEGVMDDSPFPIKRGTLAEHIVKARQIIKSYDYKSQVRDEVIQEVLSKLREQGVPIDQDGNYISG